jgi:hypothetical protein
MSEEEKLDYISNIIYFWKEKGDIERFIGYSPDKLREADPVLANAYEQYRLAEEAFTRLVG